MIKHISDDSRKVKKDDVYICTLDRNKGTKYVEEALAKGAIVYGKFAYKHLQYYQVQEEGCFKKLLNAFYAFDFKDKIVIGICGTNGKTSIATMLYENVKEDAILISTHHVYCKDEHFETSNTTPNAFELAAYIDYAIQKECKYIIMEVSSHAIDQERIFFMQYDYIIYSNITSDHLDYHFCSTHYIFTKLKLRYYLKPNGMIICYPELPYLSLVKDEHWKILSHPSMLTKDKDKLLFRWNGDVYQIPYHTNFHMENAAEVLAVLKQLGLEDIKERMKQLPIIKGRCEIFHYHGIEIWIDYAHSEDGLLQLLKNARQNGKRKCICVVGCGGNRDQQKRQKMGEIACQYADLAIYTADNPRNETISQIIMMMMNHQEKNYEIYENRYYAIKYAVKFAKKDDIIIIAGKGDERTQEINGVFYPFCDEQCVKQIIREDLLWSGS